MFSRCDNDNKSIVPLEGEVIPILHSDGVAKHGGEQIEIFQILDKLEEAVDSLLKTHPQLEVRTKQKPSGCPLCTKSFSSKKELKIHTRAHTDEKPHTCKQCSKSFSQAVRLRRHLKEMHSGEKIVQLLPMFQVVYGFIWVAGTFKNSL